MYGNLFKVKSPLASNSNVDLGDTLKTKKARNKMGFMEVPSYGTDEYPDEPMFSGIKKFQKAKGLQVDGVMNPGGETERSIAKTLVGGAAPTKSTKPTGQPKAKSNPFGFKLGGSVGIGGKNKAADVEVAKNLIKSAGFLSNLKTPKAKADPDFKFDIQRFQVANGLKMDGVMNPGGETEKKLEGNVTGTQEEAGVVIANLLPPTDDPEENPDEPSNQSECKQIAQDIKYDIETDRQNSEQVKIIEIALSELKETLRKEKLTETLAKTQALLGLLGNTRKSPVKSGPFGTALQFVYDLGAILDSKKEVISVEATLRFKLSNLETVLGFGKFLNERIEENRVKQAELGCLIIA